MNKIKQKIENKTFIAGIVGLGYVGLPLALRFVDEKFKTLGFDIDADKVKKINSGLSYIEHIPNNLIADAKEYGLSATTDFKRINEVDCVIICVPTPLDKYREPDLSYVIDTMKACAPHLKKEQIVSLESTTWPGTTEEVLKPIIENAGLKVGLDIYLVYSPEREDPGRTDFNTKTTPKVLGGCTSNCLENGRLMYEAVIDKIVPVSSCRAAEMTKLLENIHRSVNIGLVNEMKIIAEKMNIDIFEVIEAASTKPFGFTKYYPGPGIGGHCIPIDPFYLTWKAREYGVHTKFIELAGEINSYMPDYVVNRVTYALNQKSKALRGSKILVLGISYKPNIDDMRESPSVFIIEKLLRRGAIVNYSDPHVPVFPKMREHKLDLKSVDLSIENIENYDCIVLATQHKAFNYELILEHAKIIVDARGVYDRNNSKVVRA